VKLTKSSVDAAEVEPSRDSFLWDSTLPGFGLRISRGGTKSYIIQYRNAEGRTRRFTLGRHGALTPERARSMATRKLAEVAEGRDPMQERVEMGQTMFAEPADGATRAQQKGGSESRAFFSKLLALPEGEKFLDFIQCGLCVGSCPLGYAMEYPPRKILLQARSGTPDQLFGSPSVWMCVGCYTCSLRCPRQLDLTDGLWPALRDWAMQGGAQPPVEVQKAFQNVYLYGNVLGQSPKKRLEWAKDLDVPVIDLSQEDREVDVLFLVGDYPSYYPRNQAVARAFARILTALEVSWGVLGKDERNPGDCDRLFGEEGLFEMLVETNTELFSRHRFEKMVLLDPHGYRALQKFYPPHEALSPSQHYVMFLADKLDQLKPLLTRRVEATVTYHDNCCVGRRCSCYDPPRQLLEAIPGITLVEMARNRDNALCCGGGGGGMWLDAHIVEHGGQRLSDERVLQADATGAEILAVSCPYELSRFEDSVKVAGLEGEIKVRDILELLAESMGLKERD
jgi:Fe-S oxidoreductase